MALLAPPEHAAAIITFAESDECGRCRGGRRTVIRHAILVFDSGSGSW